jgi:ElaB/YqjD/DUF883 family membrane-anchored ribosome-binding protein
VGKRVTKAGGDRVTPQTNLDDLGVPLTVADTDPFGAAPTTAEPITDENEVDDATVEATAIRSDIEQTRADMTETINALQEKLDPDKIAAQVKEKVKESAGDAMDAAKDTVRDATIGRAERMVSNVADSISDVTGISRRDMRESGSSVVDYISSRPLAFSLLGIGLGMLAFGGRDRSERRNPRYERYRTGGRQRYAYDDYSARSGSRQGAYAGGYDEVGYSGGEYPANPYYRTGTGRVGPTRSSNVGSDLTDSADSMTERAGEAVGSAASAVKETVSDAADYAREVPTQLRSQARTASYRAQSAVNNNPMIAGLAAFSLGAILGLALPETETENRYIGEASEEFTERAKSVAQDATETVTRVAKETGEKLKQESQGSIDTLRQGAEDAANQVKTEMAHNLESNTP